nr:alcohol dehydrogenase catalytic domain-containing protein [Brachybacterium sacelli]
MVRVTAAAICGSDRHTVTGLRESPCPGILGHEGVGVIVALGTFDSVPRPGAGPGAATGPIATGSAVAADVDGRPLAVGDRIVWSVVSACGGCDRCRAGHSAKCRRLLKAGHEALDSSWPLSGSFATHVLLPAGHAVVRAGAEVSDGAAAISACAGATVMAALDAGPSRNLAGARVLVSGVGMLGLLAVLAARAAGATDIRAIDPSPTRRALAERAGASFTLAPEQSSVGPVDLALEFSGVPTSVTSVLEALDVGSTAVLAGSVFPGPAVGLDPEQVVRGRHTITGVHNYEPQHLAQAVALLSTEHAAVLEDPVVLSTPVGLDAVPDAFAAPTQHLRTLVRP